MKSKKNNLTIGLISGTSFDGIDAALVTFMGNDITPHFVDGLVYKYPKIIKEKIRNLINVVETCRGMSLLQEIAQLNFLIGEVFADAALKLIRKNKLKTSDILLIGSHGQTIYHHPKAENLSGYKVRSTLQIGESSVIAERTGIKTISNFREGDIACGGQGAPLVPFLDWVIFNQFKEISGVLNIGGISNITIVGGNIKPIAFDIGPGNALMDYVTNKYFDFDFDKEGRIAKSGKIHFELIKAALKDNYFKIKPPKTTGKEYFNNNFIQKHFKIKDKKDLLATVTFFTAATIHKAFNDLILPKYPVKKLVISGGGLNNSLLIKHVKELLPNIEIGSSDAFSLPSKYKEAILFALLGYTCHLGIPNNIPSCTGAKKKVITGKIVNV